MTVILCADVYTMKNYMAPKLSNSCVSYRDIFFDPILNKVSLSSPLRSQRQSVPSCSAYWAILPMLCGAFLMKAGKTEMLLYTYRAQH